MKSPSTAIGLALVGTLLLPCPVAAECIEYGDYIHWVACARNGMSALRDVVVSGNLVCATEQDVAGGERGLMLVDVSDPLNPWMLGSVATPGQGERVAVSGSFAFVTLSDPWKGLVAVDISTPQEPEIVGSLAMTADPRGLAVSGAYVYVADGADGLQVVDASDPADLRIVAGVQPPKVSTVHLPRAHDVAVSGNYAYVAAGDLEVVDITNPLHPRLVGTARGIGGNGVDVSGGYACTVDASALYVVDVSVPSAPRLVGTAPGCGGFSVTASGTHAFVANWDGAKVVDFQIPEAPHMRATLTTCYPFAVAVSGGYAYVADASVVDVIDLGNLLDPPILGSGSAGYLANDVAILGTHAYVVDSTNEFAGEFRVFDVADPRNPIALGVETLATAALAVAASGSYAYVTTMNRFRVIDVSDPSDPRVVGSNSSGGFGVAVSGTHAYVCDSEYLRVISISNPGSPVLVGSVYVGWGQLTRVAVSGSYAYVVNFDGLRVVDVSDSHHPMVVGGVETGNWGRGVVVTGDYAYVADYDEGLQIVDVSSPAGPRVIGGIRPEGASESVAVLGDHAYVGGHISGVTVLDVTDPQNPRIVGNVGLPDEACGVFASDACVCAATYRAGLQIVPVQCEAGARSGVAEIRSPGPEIRVAAYRNPARGRTTIHFEPAARGRVRADICDAAGRRIRSLYDGVAPAGLQDLDWNGRDDLGRSVAAGVYLARVAGDGWTRTVRLVVLK